MIWFTSDTHYNHKNIVRGCSKWDIKEPGSSHQETRNFDTLEKHNAALVTAINSRVKADDVLYHLGDWSFGGFDSIKTFRDQLAVQQIHLIFGNHDHHIENNRGNVQGLFSTVQYYKEISISGHRVVMSHYAMRVWNKSHHGSIMLFGHSHNTLSPGNYAAFKTMDVGVDTNDNLAPYSWEEIQRIMARRKPLLGVDHHSTETN